MQEPFKYKFDMVKHYYGESIALDIKELTISKGTIIGLAGPNGSGKTTLLKLMTFAEKPSFGQILFNGKKEQLFSPNVRFKISLLTQKPYLLKRTVFENTAYGLKIRGNTENLKTRVAEALSKVGLPFERFAERRWHELSGGEAQRVALAARLILRPEVLLLDEPTASVDTESAMLIRDASLAARNDWGTTIVIASHDQQWLNEISDTSLHLFNGKVMKPGSNTMLPGPWTTEDNHLFSIDLGQGQLFFAHAPPSKDAVGIIMDDDVRLDAPETSHGFVNQLKGSISQLVLDPRDLMIVASIKVDDLVLTTRIHQNRAAEIALYPGRAVTLFVSSSKVTWL